MLSHFQCEATLRAHQEEWLSVEILVCPPTLLGQVRQALPCSPAAVPWLSRLQAIAEDPTESSRGLLGQFSSTQMNLIEILFVSMGEPDPWRSIINPIWAAQLVDVEGAWDRAPEPSPDLTSGETPQWGFASFETHMQNRLPSSTENSYREEERDSRVFLKACDKPASQLNPDRDKIFNFPENKFFAAQQLAWHLRSS